MNRVTENKVGVKSIFLVEDVIDAVVIDFTINVQIDTVAYKKGIVSSYL